jgi:hypothetical protein
VTAATGGAGLGSVIVEVYTASGNLQNEAFSGANGTYTVTNLPSATSDAVCFDASNATGGTSTTGYASQCYKNVPWGGGFTPPSGTTPVPVTGTGTTSNINAALIDAGGISGTVTAASGGGGLGSVTVDLFNSAGNFVTSTSTAGDGTYSIIGLASSSSYAVCFDASSASGGSSTTGYASQCYNKVPWAGGFTAPSGTTPVSVTAGTTTTGIDGALTDDGGISGTVTAASGGGDVSSVTVDIYDSTGNTVTSTTTASDGTYTVIGLTPSATGYTVCFDASFATGGSSTTGYASQCYNDVPWAGGFTTLPSGTTAVPVSAGATASGINAALTADGAISGTVTAASGGGNLNMVTVDLYNSSGSTVTNTSTAGDGTYTIIGLAPSATGYTVCFDASGATGGSSTTGYASQCYNDVPWAGGFTTLPSGTTPVPVSAGATASGINASLTAEGAISGTVTAATGGGGVGSVTADVYDSAGNTVTSTSTAANGTYKIIGLAPSAIGYTVCFDASGATGGGSTTGYNSQCYNNVAWSPGSTPPAGTTPVPVSAGAVSSGINAVLASDGGISGTVTAATGGAGVAGVSVRVINTFNGDEVVASTSTGSTGAYKVVGLTPSTSGYVVCFDASIATGGGSTTGYASQCYKNVAWDGGFTPPSGTTLVPVSAGAVASGINAALIDDGGVSGTVTAATGGAGVASVSVEIFESNGVLVKSASSAANGSYKVIGLTPSTTGYTVCFDARNATGGSSTTGYASQCYKNVPWTAVNGAPPAGTTAVPVTAGATAGAINAALTDDGAVSGTVTAAVGGAGLDGVSVEVIDVFNGDNTVRSTSTGRNGTYKIIGLAPSTAGYAVCFDAGFATGGSSTTGYASQCYKNLSWPGSGAPPAGTTAVPVSAGATAGGINATLTDDGAVSGTVTAASGGAGLDSVAVEIFGPNGNFVTTGSTSAAGTYDVTGLAPSSTGYAVCFDATSATGGSSTTGYASQCYKNVPWSGGFTAPAGTTPVAVSAGATTSGINAALTADGGISGTVTAASGGAAVGSVIVDIYDSSGNFLTSSLNAANGTYTITGLTPSAAGYTVCFDATSATGGSSTTGYASQCYSGQAWTPYSTLPPGATAIPVSAGAVAGGINAALIDDGGISGTVTAATGGGALGSVTVDVFDSSGITVKSASTSNSGTYHVIGLTPSTTGYTVCFGATGATGGSSTTGYMSQCYNAVAWSDNGIPPAGTTAVPVTAGQVAPGINAALASGGAITGTVTAATGGADLGSVRVDLFDSNGFFVTTTNTSVAGTYDVVGLTPSMAGYSVCFDATSATGGSSATGYISQCYKNQPWVVDTTPPAGATPVPVSAGATASSIDAALSSGGGITGKVTATVGGAGLTGVLIDVVTSTGIFAGSATTGSSGSYSVTGLAPSTTGYTVCFDATSASGGTSTTGYGSQCFKGVPWDGGAPLEKGITPVPVSAGIFSAANASLPPGAGITGKVSAASGGAALSGVNVDVFDATGNMVASVATAGNGTYSVKDLAISPTPYTVCFDASQAARGSSTGYASQCYNGVPWGGSWLPPSPGAAPVAVTGQRPTVINVALASAGAIGGTVTGPGGSLAGVVVDVFDSADSLVASATTSSTGAYTVPNLAPSATGYKVCFNGFNATGGNSTTGYASQCNNNVSWPGGQSSPPVSSVAVPISSGTTTTVSPLLTAGGVIAGTTTAAGGGALGGVVVHVFDNTGHFLTSVPTAADGTYAVRGLAASTTGYDVCFDASAATGGKSVTGYASQCYKNIPWTNPHAVWSGGHPAAGSTAVPVAAGATAGGINAVLPAQTFQGIAGKVSAATGGAGLSGVMVEAFDSTGNLDGSTTTLAGGAYQLALAPSSSGYTICFDGLGGTTGTSVGGYLSQCNINKAWTPGSPPPAGTTAVPVSAGTSTTVNAALVAAGGVSGTVTAATGGGPLTGVAVEVFNTAGNQVGTTSTAFNGTYRVTGLAAAANGYAVCFDPSAALGGKSTGGYARVCYKTVAWTGLNAPAPGSTPVSVTAGAVLAGINVALPGGTAISGTVIAAGGAGLGRATVDVFNSSRSLIGSASTLSDGSYTVGGLPAESGNVVCFDPRGAFGGTSSTGYAPQCDSSVPWIAGSTPPKGTAAITTTAGTTTSGIDAQLAPAGAIAGTVTAAVGSTPLEAVQVRVSDASGNNTRVATAANGSFDVSGLPASTTGYYVCFLGAYARSTSSTTGFASQCNKGVAWSGTGPPPAGSKPVPVAAGSTAGGVNAQLAATGGISGKVTASVGGAALAGVNVSVFKNTAVVGAAGTVTNGTYTVTGLPASTTGYSVCFDASFAGTATVSYASQCYKTPGWNSNGPPPAGTTAVKVSAGALTPGINVALATAGSIAGTVTSTKGGALSAVTVIAFSGKSIVALANTSATGTYALSGLAASKTGYIVCFDDSQATGTGFAAGYASQCYKNVAWTGTGVPPTGTTAVPVTAGKTSAGINASVAPTAAAPASSASAAGSGASAAASAVSAASAYAAGATSFSGIEMPVRSRPGTDRRDTNSTRAAQPAGSASDCDPNDLPGGSEGPDDDGDECTFTVTGDHPISDKTQNPNSDQSSTTATSAMVCSPDKFAEYEDYAQTIIGYLQENGAPTGAAFLQEFLSGSGLPDIEPDGSPISEEAKNSYAFQQYDIFLQQYKAIPQWDAGIQDVTVDDPPTVSWGYKTAAGTELDLFSSFGGTQGMHFDGTAQNNDGTYTGDITYTITDIYGWNILPTGVPGFNDFRPDMHYLQTYCGPPYNPNGPRWFKSGVIVKVPIPNGG